MTLNFAKLAKMASYALLRCCTRGGQLLFRSKITTNGSLSCLMRPDLTSTGSQSSLLRPDVTTKHFTLTPASSGALDYFRARRGPFTPAEKQGNHMIFSSTHWKIERILAVSMLGIMPGALVYQGPLMDMVLTLTVFMHAFWAFDHVLSDYLQKFIPFIHYIWYAVSILAFAGLIHFNYNDVGVTKAIAMLWKL